MAEVSGSMLTIITNLCVFVKNSTGIAATCCSITTPVNCLTHSSFFRNNIKLAILVLKAYPKEEEKISKNVNFNEYKTEDSGFPV